MVAESAKPIDCALTADSLVRQLRHLPSAPDILPPLKRLLRDGNSAMSDVVALIRLDAGIVARVLQMANSAYFCKGARCVSIDEAIQRVGFDQVYELVSYAVASQVLVRPLEAYAIEARELWKMSVCGALAATALAERLGQDGEVAYTVGLLHCVGMVAIDEWIFRHARGLRLEMEAFPREATVAERATLGFTQAESGGALLRLWGFPGAIAGPVRWQYAPGAAGSHTAMATMLRAAKWIRDVLCDRGPSPLEPSHLQAIRLTPELVEALVVEVEARLRGVQSLLETASTRTAGSRNNMPVA